MRVLELSRMDDAGAAVLAAALGRNRGLIALSLQGEHLISSAGAFSSGLFCQIDQARKGLSDSH